MSGIRSEESESLGVDVPWGSIFGGDEFLRMC